MNSFNGRVPLSVDCDLEQPHDQGGVCERQMADRQDAAVWNPLTSSSTASPVASSAFGCVTGGLHCRKSPSGVEFTWEGNNEMDQASGAGWAELQKDGSLTGEIRFHKGDDSTFKARRW
jgi:hypothetical protein